MIWDFNNDISCRQDYHTNSHFTCAWNPVWTKVKVKIWTMDNMTGQVSASYSWENLRRIINYIYIGGPRYWANLKKALWGISLIYNTFDFYILQLITSCTLHYVSILCSLLLDMLHSSYTCVHVVFKLSFYTTMTFLPLANSMS